MDHDKRRDRILGQIVTATSVKEIELAEAKLKALDAAVNPSES